MTDNTIYSLGPNPIPSSALRKPNQLDNSLFAIKDNFQSMLVSQLLDTDNSNTDNRYAFPSIFGGLSNDILELLEQLMAQDFGAERKSNSLPVVGGILSQGYHGDHQALDLAIPVGTPVSTTQAGKVTYAGWNDEGYGNLVIIENGPYQTYYAHLSEIDVQVGQSIPNGFTVGKSGNTGNSTGPHLHYEIRKNGQKLDPNDFHQLDI